MPVLKIPTYDLSDFIALLYITSVKIKYDIHICFLLDEVISQTLVYEAV